MGKKADKIEKAAKKAKAADKKLAAVEEAAVARAPKTSEKKGAGKPDKTLEKVAKKAKKAREQVGSVVETLDPDLAAADVRVEAPELMARLRVGDGFRLTDVDPSSTPGFDGGKDAGEVAMAQVVEEIAALQERLYAESRAGGGRSVLLVIQGMDTSGKGGIMRHVVGLLDPQGVSITAFKKPTPEERRHPFLWRIRKALPEPGIIGVFDRSHYEDVLVARVDDLVPASTWRRRYSQIRTFEKSLTSGGTTVVKVMLHISSDEQKERLAERLDRPDKHWKYNPGDVDVRLKWDAYQEAYEEALVKTSTDDAPWYVVPADRKWFARLAVQQILLETLRGMEPQWPMADFDVEAEKARLAES